MKIKNKKLLSLMLSFSMMLSFTGCSKVKNIIYEFKNQDKSSSDYFDPLNADTTISISKSPTDNSISTTEKKESSFYSDEENICVVTNVNLRKAPSLDSSVLIVVDEFEKLKRIKTNGEWDYVFYDDIKGYVASKYTKELSDTYVEVDISDQNLYLYLDDELALSTDVVTGKKGKYDTRLGCNPIYTKEKDRYLKGEDYKVYVNYWLGFDKGQGLHDATWRDSFDKDDYLNGSHGCVNMRYNDAKYVYDNVEVGTKVLVHK